MVKKNKAKLENPMNHLCLREMEVAEIFKVTARQVRNWVSDACPLNPDRSYNLYNVHNWLLEREIKKHKPMSQGGNLDDQKTIKQIELLTERIEKQKIDNEELKSLSVLKSDMDKQFGERLEHLLICLVNEPKMNSWMYENKSTDEARDLLNAFIRRAMMEYKGSFEVAMPEAEDTTNVTE